jgi:hypothetical protein
LTLSALSSAGLPHPSTFRIRQGQRSVLIRPEARRALVRQLYLSGQHHCGVLSGISSGNVLTIRRVAPGGLPCGTWPPPGLHVSPRGAEEAHEHIERLTWTGHWLARPEDGHRPTVHSDLVMVQQAMNAGLIDTRAPLIAASWDQGLLHISAYQLQGGDFFRLPVQLTP